MTAIFQETGALLLRLLLVLRVLARGRCDAKETLRLTDNALRDTGPTVVVSCFIIGGIVGLQGLGYLTRYNATEVFGWAAALSAFRDVGPLLLAFALAARVGTRNSAQTATLAAKERLDALCALGLDPHAVETAPRVVAVVVCALLLYPVAAFGILVTAFSFARVLGGQNIAISVWSVVNYVTPVVIVEGMLRLVFFGAIIGLCTTHAGLSLWQQPQSGSRASAVGGAVYFGSVLSLCGVVIVNLVMSLLGGTG
jgi:phospholipid/cholesterol/gamma-HCH transport system permease protein